MIARTVLVACNPKLVKRRYTLTSSPAGDRRRERTGQRRLTFGPAPCHLVTTSPHLSESARGPSSGSRLPCTVVCVICWQPGSAVRVCVHRVSCVHGAIGEVEEYEDEQASCHGAEICKTLVQEGQQVQVSVGPRRPRGDQKSSDWRLVAKRICGCYVALGRVGAAGWVQHMQRELHR
ncbi:hypothetical protein M011DRAFT_460495 [Sporormia fimetaria CBS 119925]|uniref:Uncharacterized protein n=1 Tax=Sporormia fimetaria CBS 119925 TaxID=1340428 RepID=A0A6A6V352_9PLEO|nr:hypothetical protein M011DRAFT_460495 [Sporormia fimetaria CBS 119925]